MLSEGSKIALGKGAQSDDEQEPEAQPGAFREVRARESESERELEQASALARKFEKAS